MDEKNTKLFYLKKKVIFPYSNQSVMLKTSEISNRIEIGEHIIAYPVRSLFDLLLYKNKIATIAEVLETEKKEGSIILNLKGLSRVHIKKIIRYRNAEHEIILNSNDDTHESLNEELRRKCQELIFLINVKESDTLINLMNYIVSLDQLTDFISNYFIVDFKNRYRVFRELDSKIRGLEIIKIIDSLIGSINKKG